MTAEDVIRTHTEGFNRALTTHDLDALSAIYADDYMLVRPDGSVLGKRTSCGISGRAACASRRSSSPTSASGSTTRRRS